jgi:hypothetical protein
MKPRLVHAIAKARLLDPSAAAVERLELALVSALKADDWIRAKRVLELRRELSQLRDSPEVLATLARLADDIEYAQAQGLRRGRDAEGKP